MRLDGKVAVVTGGGSAFGEGIARRFAEEGAKVVVNDIDDRGGERVVATIEKAHGQGSALYMRADVADNAAMGALIKRSFERFGRIDIMVNNAGTTHDNGPMPVRSTSPATKARSSPAWRSKSMAGRCI